MLTKVTKPVGKRKEAVPKEKLMRPNVEGMWEECGAVSEISSMAEGAQHQ